MFCFWEHLRIYWQYSAHLQQEGAQHPVLKTTQPRLQIAGCALSTSGLSGLPWASWLNVSRTHTAGTKRSPSKIYCCSYLNPTSTKNNGPRPLNRAQKPIVLHTVGIQVLRYSYALETRKRPIQAMLLEERVASSWLLSGPLDGVLTEEPERIK